jgi:hypothetical protein
MEVRGGDNRGGGGVATKTDNTLSDKCLSVNKVHIIIALGPQYTQAERPRHSVTTSTNFMKILYSDILVFCNP